MLYRTVKISHIFSNAMLTPKFQLEKFSASEMTPKNLLGWRGITAKLLTELFQRGQIENTAHMDNCVKPLIRN
jgi:hypothetical protein